MATRFNVRSEWLAIELVCEHVSARTTWLGAIAFVCVALSGCGFYSADPITARVVDGDTGAPLEGVNVVAAWEVRGGSNYGAVVGYMNVMEAVTDKDGQFHFSGWGPRPNFHSGKIRNASPALRLFKSSYRYNAMDDNDLSVLAFAPSRMKSSWDGKVIVMQRFRGTATEYEASLISLGTDIFTLSRQDRLSDLPKFLCTLALQEKALLAEGVHSELYSFRRLRDHGVECLNRRG